MLMESVTERRNSERHANIAYKVTQAMELMKAHGELSGTYPTTEAFVDELQKYLKISKRCDSNHIAECWPTDKVIDGDGNEFEVSKAKTGKNLSLTTNTNNVGLILADGTPLILNYNPDADRIDEGTAVTAVYKSLPVGGGKSKDFAFTSTVTNSIDFVTDVNGSHGPNKETANNKYNDIRNLTIAKFTKGCAGTDIPGIGCVVNIGTSYDGAAPGSAGQLQYDPNWPSELSSYTDYWAGAKAKCVSMGMTLPDFGTLWSIYNQKGNYDTLPQSGWFWSSSETSTDTAWGVDFGNGSIGTLTKYFQNGVLCVDISSN